MFERFTGEARRVVFESRRLAIARGDDRIGPLHMLSALSTGDGVAARVLTEHGIDSASVAGLLGPAAGAAPDTEAEALASIGIDVDEIRRKAEETFGEGALDRIAPRGGGSLNLRGHSALTDDAKSVLAQSHKEAVALHHNYIGSGHLLLGLLRTADAGPSTRRGRGRGGSGLRQAVATLGLSDPEVRDQVLALLAAA
jgi:ATP-dependent Clp protease ATP-binding subunit ClpA